MYAKERKWGICQQNKIPNKAAVIDEISLFAANHPPMGGKAPGIAPIKVLIDDIFFNGVYIAIYEKTVKNERNETNRVTFI